jgi:V/A-type H+-transporting ATPase subunit F
MKMFLISDNIDTKIGLRLAGIEGIVVHEKDEAEKALEAALKAEDIAVILITDKLSKLLEEKVNDFKLKVEKPLIVTIPDRHGKSDDNAIERYVREAIGLNI